jgi:hypothetical protein
MTRGVSFIMVYDSLGSDTGHGSDDIIGSETTFETFFGEIFSHVVAECFATGGFGDIVAEVRVGEDFVEVVVDFAGFSHDAVFVVFLFAVGGEADCTVDEDVSWTGVEIVASSNSTVVGIWNEADLKLV